MKFLDYFLDFIKDGRQGEALLACGDHNICHKAIDIHDPIRNKYSSGFLLEEREWITSLLDLGFIDTYFKPFYC